MKEAYIRKLISILENSKLQTLELSSFWGMDKILLTKNTQAEKNTVVNNSPMEISKQNTVESRVENLSTSENIDSSQKDSKDKIEEVLTDENIHTITAPLVGTFYQSSKPGDPPFIKVGDSIKSGQIICIIEAMKIFNEIESEVDGVVKNICIDDSSPVEYGQVLFDIQIND